MYADRFDYRTAAGLHRERLAEAESIRRAYGAKKALKEAKAEAATLKYRLGCRLIAIGERMTA